MPAVEDAPVKRFTTVHSRYQVICSCCGLVTHEQRKQAAKDAMVAHMNQHDEPELKLSVYDLMHRRGGRIVYGGRIYGGVKSHGLGVGYDTATGKAR